MRIGMRIASTTVAMLLCISAVMLAVISMVPTNKAYADDTAKYTLGITVDKQFISVASGIFGAKVDLACVGESEYTMYAFSSTIKWDNKKLILSDYEADGVDAYLVDYDGYSEIVLNYMSDSVDGTTWESPKTVLTMTFKPKWAGKSEISIERVNVSDSTGLKSLPCTNTNAPVDVMAAAGAVVGPPASTTSNTTSGNTQSSVIAALGDGFPIVLAAVIALVAACVVMFVRKQRAK